MKALVTGGAGFIGSHLVDALIEKGEEVLVLDDLSSGKKENVHPKAKLVVQNISDQETPTLVSDFRPDYIFHLAAQALVPVSVRDPLHDAMVNVVGFLNVMEGAVKAGAKKVVYSSTGGAIYGDILPIPTPESVNPRPISPYGITKLTGERYLDFYREVHGVEATILRYANVYGPRQNPFGEGGAVAIFTQKFLSGEAPTIFGDGSQTRDYVYVGDVVVANLKAREVNSPGPFNIGTGIETKTEDLFRSIQKIFHSEIEPVYADERAGDLKRSALDRSLAGKELSWKPTYSLTRGLEETIKWFQDASSR